MSFLVINKFYTLQTFYLTRPFSSGNSIIRTKALFLLTLENSASKDAVSFSCVRKKKKTLQKKENNIRSLRESIVLKFQLHQGIPEERSASFGYFSLAYRRFFSKYLVDILGAFHLGKKTGNFGGKKSGISDW